MVKKTMVVFGASGGIGSCVVSDFQEYNKSLASRSLSFYSDETSLSDSVDVRNAGQVKSFVERTHEKFGSIDVVVNCVGVINVKSIQDIDLYEFMSVFDTNVFGLLNILKETSRYLENGFFINIGSLRDAIPCRNRAAYCSSKAAMCMLIKVFRLEHPSIKVCNINPGYVDTDLHPDRKYPYDKKTMERKEVLSARDVVDKIKSLLRNPVDEVEIGEVFGGRDDICLM